MKPVCLAILIGILTGLNVLALIPQDPPHPDAVAFCTVEHKDPAYQCSCANTDDNGVACTLNDNQRPRFCKWMCGHARSCSCCAS